MKRVMIIGNSGTGKSTLAKKLGGITGLPVYFGDQFQWMENWTARPAEERDTMFLEVIGREEWVIDGNYSSTMDARAARADTIIFMDFARASCLLRVGWRTLKYYGKNRPDMPKGCNERFDWEFCKWIWDYDARERMKALELTQSPPPGSTAHRFTRQSDVNPFLQLVQARFEMIN